MPFRLPKKTRAFFSDITDTNKNNETKFNMLFDGYYLSLLVGLSQAKRNENADLEPTEIADAYPGSYSASCDYIAGLLIATEAKCLGIPMDDANALERLMKELIDSQSKTRLSLTGENRLNQYAARGTDVMIDKMIGKHSCLEDFFQDYFTCFEKGAFFE